MKKPTLKRWDAAEHLKDEQDCLLYLQAVMEDADGNEKLIKAMSTLSADTYSPVPC